MNTEQTTTEARLPQHLTPITPRQALGLKVLGLSDKQVETLIAWRSRRIVEDAIARRKAKRQAEAVSCG